MTNLTKNPSYKSWLYRRQFWLLAALLLAVVLVLFLTFRPVGNEQLVQDDGEKKIYKAVVYDTKNWQVAGVAATDITSLKSYIGSTATQEETLDFYGKPASSFRYSAAHEPPLYVVESDGLLELVWYYAAASDNEPTKSASLNFAKRAYLMMSAADAKKGTNIVHQILQGVPMAEQTVGAFELLNAQCQDYRCQIVLRQR